MGREMLGWEVDDVETDDEDDGLERREKWGWW